MSLCRGQFWIASRETVLVIVILFRSLAIDGIEYLDLVKQLVNDEVSESNLDGQDITTSNW